MSYYVGTCLTVTNYTIEKVCKAMKKEGKSSLHDFSMVCKELCRYDKKFEIEKKIEPCDTLKCGIFFSKQC